MKNNGNGTFAATTTLATGVAGSSCLPTDINGDGQFELLYTSDAYITGNPVFRVYTNDGNANFSQYSTESNSSIKYIRSAFDYDGNQTPDVLHLNPDIQVHLNHSGLSYSLSTPTVLAADNGWPYTGDLDGDGDLDVFNANSYNGSNWNTFPLKYFLNNGSGTFTTTTTALVLPLLWTTDLSDYDSDGDLDHLYLNPATGEIRVALNGATISISTTIANINCPGGADGSVALSVSGGTSPYTYLWNNGQTTATATGLVAGIYTATVTDINGSTATTSATVTQPTAL
ncbi:MAG: VCBS repeat-containing protein [Lewinellaceae bacterium]|nr:VCBS repeat-containing protein [Lewinellaceae bacterium]